MGIRPSDGSAPSIPYKLSIATQSQHRTISYHVIIENLRSEFKVIRSQTYTQNILLLPHMLEHHPFLDVRVLIIRYWNQINIYQITIYQIKLLEYRIPYTRVILP